jgi:uncharacterized protein YndB with AHSA1/START domain
MGNILKVEAIVNKPVADVWAYYTSPEHVVNWNNASEDWHTPKAENDLRAGGTFTYTMEAKDGSFSFDFGGTYNEVITNEKIDSTLGDGRTMVVDFQVVEGGTHVITQFEAENQNPEEMQIAGWQAILNNFKKYAEAL